MGNQKGVLTGSGWTSKQKPESIRGPNHIMDNGYKEVNWEWAGNKATVLERRNGPDRNW